MMFQMITVEKSLQISCYDCHSNNTQYPWYNKVQPVAWFLRTILKMEKQSSILTNGEIIRIEEKSKLTSIINQIEDGEMLWRRTLLFTKMQPFQKPKTGTNSVLEQLKIVYK